MKEMIKKVVNKIDELTDFIAYRIIFLMFAIGSIVGIFEGINIVKTGVYNFNKMLIVFGVIGISLALIHALKEQEVNVIVIYEQYDSKEHLRKLWDEAYKTSWVIAKKYLVLTLIVIATIKFLPVISGIVFIMLNIINIVYLKQTIFPKENKSSEVKNDD
ncbi:MAG: hypothetical protein E7311_05010 [Clostridiales bacterium]|nr:hypothetical protein [Clostridiales bacterium]